MKRCIHCGTDIPFVASRCPNCTTVLNMSGADGDVAAFATVILLLVVSSIVVGIVELVKRIIGY